MFKLSRSKMARKVNDERGYMLLLALVFLLFCALMITPLLNYMSTGIKTGEIYETKTEELYAADAGIEDAIWQIKYDHLDTLFTSPPYYPAYDLYDYTANWTYIISEQVNGFSVNVTIENEWIPDLYMPTKQQANYIIQAGKLMVTGSIPQSNTYQIKIYYTPSAPEEADDLLIETLGVWLPANFEYVDNSSNLEDTGVDYYSDPVVSSHHGGKAVVWTFSPSYPFVGSEDPPELEPFPGVNPLDETLVSIIDFEYIPTHPGQKPDAIAWIKTSGVSDIPYSWDADTKIYHITSKAGETEIEAYIAKGELRELGSAIAGDYRAIGNSLMVDTPPYSTKDIKDDLLDESTATVNDIPTDAEVEAAYLYWSAWLDDADTSIWEDPCYPYFEPNWDHSVDWNVSGSYSAFYGHDYGGDGTLKMTNSLDLSGYADETLTASWRNWNYRSSEQEGDDCLQYGFSANGTNFDWYDDLGICGNLGTSPVEYSVTIPEEYVTSNFKIGFRIQNYGDDNEYVYIDDVEISLPASTIADKLVIFKIDGNQVCYSDNGTPIQDDQKIKASRSSVLENKPGTYSYACYLDVTDLVKAFSAAGPEGNHPGNAVYTVGDVDGDTDDEWSYAGWSLLLIYSSTDTKGHQMFLYQDFIYSGMDQNVDFDNDGQPGGTISGFLVPDPVTGEENAAKLTCFVCEGDDYYNWDYVKFNGTALSDGQSSSDVWNSWSIGMSEEGVDIDTFYVTWLSGLLEPEDISAQIDLDTGSDSWNLVYIILSFRSEITAGGAIHYLIRG